MLFTFGAAVTSAFHVVYMAIGQMYHRHIVGYTTGIDSDDLYLRSVHTYR